MSALPIFNQNKNQYFENGCIAAMTYKSNAYFPGFILNSI